MRKKKTHKVRGHPATSAFVGESRPHKEDYAHYVEHPRFGRAPRFTGLDPDTNDSMVHLHWNTGSGHRGRGAGLVYGTAIRADLARQTPHAICAVTHYYDIDKICQDCGRRFIFFAQEQKHWYEELGFPLEADAIRCPECRKRMQHIAGRRRRYEQLCHLNSRSVEEAMEMADCCLTLMEQGIFPIRQGERVRMLLNRVPERQRAHHRFRDLQARLQAVEANEEKRKS